MCKILTILMLLTTMNLQAQNIYDFKVDALTGGTIDFSSFKGKKIMIVNTASDCGYTPQYEDLEKLYEKYKDKNLVIVGFPANNFGEQEPGTNAEIASFCQKNYGVTFPMAAKVSVEGDDITPIYRYLINEAEKLNIKNPVKWNFTKFLLNEQGELEQVFYYKTRPLSDEIIQSLN